MCFGHWNDEADVQMGRVDGYNPQNSRKEPAFDWTDVYEKDPSSSSSLGNTRVLIQHALIVLILMTGWSTLLCVLAFNLMFFCYNPYHLFLILYMQKAQRTKEQLVRPWASLKMKILRSLVLANTNTKRSFSVRKHKKYPPWRHIPYAVLYVEAT